MAIAAIRRAAGAALAAAALAILPTAGHADEYEGAGEESSAQHLTIGVDEARLLRLNRLPGAIIVGNPLIADVSVQENGLIVIVGKQYGTTNLIALDEAGEELTHLDLSVRTSGRNSLTVYRGTTRYSHNCSPRCEVELDVGDNLEFFEAVRSEIGGKFGLSTGAPQQ